MFTRLASVALVSLLVGACYGFDDATIKDCERQIREQFEARSNPTVGVAVRVDEVSMMKESPRKLTGFVKFTVTNMVAGTSNEMAKACSATMGDDGRYLWVCP